MARRGEGRGGGSPKGKPAGGRERWCGVDGEEDAGTEEEAGVGLRPTGAGGMGGEEKREELRRGRGCDRSGGRRDRRWRGRRLEQREKREEAVGWRSVRREKREDETQGCSWLRGRRPGGARCRGKGGGVGMGWRGGRRAGGTMVVPRAAGERARN